MHVREGTEDGAHDGGSGAVLWEIPARCTQFMVQAAAGCSLLVTHAHVSCCQHCLLSEQGYFASHLHQIDAARVLKSRIQRNDVGVLQRGMEPDLTRNLPFTSTPLLGITTRKPLNASHQHLPVVEGSHATFMVHLDCDLKPRSTASAEGDRRQVAVGHHLHDVKLVHRPAAGGH